jgi:hypothetical protein
MYVLTGRLRLFLGEHDLLLGVGEVAEFRTGSAVPVGSPHRSVGAPVSDTSAGTPEEPRRYEIRTRGHLGSRWPPGSTG